MQGKTVFLVGLIVVLACGGGNTVQSLYAQSAPAGSSQYLRNSEAIVLKEPLDGRGGGLIAFENEANGDYNFELWVMNADGSGQTRLTNSPGYDGAPSFSPDRKKIVFSSARDGAAHLYVFDLDALAKGNTNPPLRKLTTSGRNYYPAWSPDNSRIAFSVYNDSNVFELYTMNIDGGNATRLVDLQNSSHAAWSVDGEKIAFVSGVGEGQEIYCIDADGQNLKRLTNNAVSDNMPDWSPDGRKIAYSSSGRSYDIWIMNSDGSNARSLVSVSGLDEFPKWSPDGTCIAFRSANQIFSIKPDGSDKRQLTSLRGYSMPYDWR
ncbi:MAG: DUF5050 domain-containing protein [Spirochaetes bacterium]|nr:DUF5050 domain-containing protein [Spirochaetota bacterium]MBU0956856.1 DUF5050 domain-containing protein [Spirochaetota bacterium]